MRDAGPGQMTSGQVKKAAARKLRQICYALSVCVCVENVYQCVCLCIIAMHRRHTFCGLVEAASTTTYYTSSES